jgi:signal transduction histidine kinase/CheY-like chemotaxis protein
MRPEIALALSLFLCAAVFFIDLHEPLGMHVGTAYVLPILAMWTPQGSRMAIGIMLLSTALIWLGWIWSPPAGADLSGIVLTNRWISTVALWIFTLVLLWRIRSEKSLKRIQSELILSNERLNLALTAGAIGLYEVNLETGAMKLDAASLTNYNIPLKTDFMLQDFLQHVHPEDRAQFKKPGSSLHFLNGAWEREFRMFAPDQSGRWMRSRGAHIAGSPISVGVILDITEQKYAAGRKDDFMMILAHELRNPLAAIRTVAHVFKDLKHKDPRARRATDILVRQSLQMTGLIDGLLNLSRISHGKMRLDLQPINFGTLLKALLEHRKDQLVESGLELTTQLPSEPYWVSGDPVRLTQAIENLLENAIKFCSPGDLIAVSLQAQAGNAVLSIHDSGPGIPSESLTTIFEQFKQEKQKLARSQGGLGLGLPLAKSLIELHQGSLVARSEGKGRGTTFEISLPLIAAPQLPTTKPQQEAVLPGTSRKILIVEDNADTAEALQFALGIHGHEVSICHTAPEALDVLRRDGADIILCDIGLPGMNGYEFAREVRAHAQWQNLPLVALTGYGQTHDKQQAAAVGFDTHLLKPANLNELIGTIHKLTALGASGQPMRRSGDIMKTSP